MKIRAAIKSYIHAERNPYFRKVDNFQMLLWLSLDHQHMLYSRMCYKQPVLGGDLFVTFLLISRICFPPGWFYMPYAIIKLKIFVLKFFVDVLSLLQGVWEIVKTHYNPKNKNHRTGVFDSPNEAFWCTLIHPNTMIFYFWLIICFCNFSTPWYQG